MKTGTRAAILAMALTVAACGGGGDEGGGSAPTPTPTPAPTPAPTPTPTSWSAVRIGAGSFSASAFLPDGRSVHVSANGAVSLSPASDPGSPIRISGSIPNRTSPAGRVLDVAVDPDFDANGFLWFTVTETPPGVPDGIALALVRATLSSPSAGAATVTNPLTIWRSPALPAATSTSRFGGALAFSRDLVHIGVGDFAIEQLAQDLTNPYGKIVRIARDGSPADGNPLLGQPRAWWDIFSVGHRDPVGLFFGPNGDLYETEAGPAGGDELNIIRIGLNYGWPIVSEGSRPDGSPFPRHSTLPAATAPAFTWPTSIGPADVLRSTSERDSLQSQVLVASQANQSIIRLANDARGISEVGRIPVGSPARSVLQAPDGKTYVVSSQASGLIYRIDRNQ